MYTESALTTLATLKEWLDVPSGDVSADAALTTYIARASKFICRYISRDQLFSSNITEYKNGNGRTFMVLNVRPVTAISLIKIGQITVPPSVNQSAGYVFDTRQVYLIGYTFCWGSQNCQFNYTGGIGQSDPEVLILEQAALHLMATTWRRRGREEIVSQTMNGVQTNVFRLQDVPDEVISMLSNVKSIAPPTS